ncbi:phosphopentomutase [Rhodanobacter denitrificans]|uniref:phosphopentomutase n=1 Tax=Rhodanobacter denitrificans TaxID=666685 RepID=UPI000260E184|nr:phosphopentomutase [Rhodanobacter denitrificans]EIM04535.1 phosphopentomutase [Rhodanobacter denitrificans]UJM91579.1 phosphopentomutase [Rhodanobacter denitrificans]
MTRAIWLVCDSLGLGAAPDAAAYGDLGADTFGHIAAACVAAARGPLRLPQFSRLGLPQAHAAIHGQAAPGFVGLPAPEGLWGHAVERARGKDTPSGHWETAGVVLTQPFGVFGQAEHSFPPALLQALVTQGDVPGVLGNCHASGTEIIQRLGAEHLRNGCPIVYTSADSVFQIAAHEQAFGLERLYRLCELTRALLADYHIGRVIARPFVGDAETGFSRTVHRRDYALPPPAPTLFDALQAAGGEVIAIGKIDDIFAHRGVSRVVHAYGHDALFDATLAAMAQAGRHSLIATNFVDFDMLYGHRRDVFGYAAALEALDARLPELLQALQPDDLLVISADHGCDPVWPGSDHTRECIPVLAFAPGLAPRALGRRDSFADIGQSMASHLGLPPLAAGRSFLSPA